MITKQTAYDIWIAYDEIAKGEKLIADMEKAIKGGEAIDLRDTFGRRQNLSLGVPLSDNSRTLFDVAPSLALQVIRAHVANKRAELAAINSRAAAELSSD
jgi:prophage maintenance system killer protein